MSEEYILEARELYYAYEGNDSPALCGVSLKIKRGKKVAFVGANGSGKSTFFLCCNGILKPDKGTMLLNGNPVDYSKKGLLELRRKVGIVFQDPDNQLFSASVFQEISFGPMNLGIPEHKVREEVEQVMEELNITPFCERPAHALSGGQKKQVSVADVLVMHPDIVILDEPAAALDAKHADMMNQIIDRMSGDGITVLLSTHDIDYALSWADEIVLMHEGKILMKADPVTVCSNQEALKLANQREPSVLKLYRQLQNKGMLKQREHPPVNFTLLGQYISEEMDVAGGERGK